MMTLLATTYGLVLCAEVVGDKTLYTIGTLATRYRLLPVLCGSTVAFMLKMLAAVLIGGALSHLPPGLLVALSAGTFFVMAAVIWIRKPEMENRAFDSRCSAWGIAAAAFAGIFFSEWGDVGQLAAASLAARSGAPSIVWLGAVLAMITKGSLALTVGASVRTRIPPSVLRYATFSLCMLMGIMAMVGFDP